MATQQFTPPVPTADGVAAQPIPAFAPPVAATVPAPVGGGLPAQSAPKTAAVSFRPSDFTKQGFLDEIAVTILSARWVNDFQYTDAQGKPTMRLNPSTNMNEPIPLQLALKVVYHLDDGNTSEQSYTAGNRDRFDLINEGRGLMGDDKNKGIPDSTNVSFFIEQFVAAGLVETFLDGNDMGHLDGFRVLLRQLPPPNRNFREPGPSAAGASGPTQGQQRRQNTIPVPVHIYSAPGEAVQAPAPVAAPVSVAPPVVAPITIPAPIVAPITAPAPVPPPAVAPTPVAVPPIQPPPTTTAAPAAPDAQLTTILTTELTEFVTAQRGNGVANVVKGAFVANLIGKYTSIDQELAGRLVQALGDEFGFFNGMVASGAISAYDQVTITF